jgi:hypothetical protein
MIRLARLTLALLCALALAACTGAGGSATGQSQSCRSTATSGSCEGSLRTVRGNYTYRIENDVLKRGTPLRVQVQLTVESGGLRVALTDVDGRIVEATARPGEPVDLTGETAIGDFESAPVALHVVEGEEVTGIAYVIAWERP